MPVVDKLKALFAESANGQLTYAGLRDKLLGEAAALKYDWVRLNSARPGRGERAPAAADRVGVRVARSVGVAALPLAP